MVKGVFYVSGEFKEILSEKGKITASAERTLQIKSVTDYIDRHITETLRLNRIANALCVSVSYLSHSFKAKTGLTILQYIKLKRLVLTKEYFDAGMTLTDASAKAGFEDYRSFYVAYQREYGVSPSKHAYPFKKY